MTGFEPHTSDVRTTSCAITTAHARVFWKGTTQSFYHPRSMHRERG